MEKYQVSNIDMITPELVVALINRYKELEVPRLNKLYDYYLGETDIFKRIMADPAKPNNKISHPFSSLITDTIVGYFAGKPVNYQSQDRDLMIKVQSVFDDNSEDAHNKKLAKQAVIMGVSYELIYMSDEDIKIKVLDPRDTFLIFDDTMDGKVLAGVHFVDIPDYVNDSITTKFYIYAEDTVSEYILEEEDASLIDANVHHWGRVPITKYLNNDDGTGAFEKVLTLIDAYDLATSDTQNNLEYFADAYLAITGAEFEDDSDVSTMKEDRVMLLPEGAKAEWLTKEISQEVEEFKNRLKTDIHELSQIPNLNDGSFSSQQSGEALKYKLFGLENLVSSTEGYFKQALERRVQLITHMLNIKSPTPYDYTAVSIAFTRNIPQNLTALADIASKLTGIISDETLFTLLPFVDNPALEAERVNGQLGYTDDFHAKIEQNKLEYIAPEEE